MNNYNNLDKFTSTFLGISLEELNLKAAMLERSENKYIFTLENIYSVLDELYKNFDILDIKGKRVFTYETVYFDDVNNICYNHHHQGKRQRFKVRTRKYVDSNLHFFEVKLKDKRDSTNKKRYACSSEDFGKMTEEGYNFTKGFFSKLYKKKFLYDLSASSTMSYKRITLVAKGGSERLTIDYDLTLYDDHGKVFYVVPKDFIIIETKSKNGNGIADKIFRASSYKPTGCSKFCLSKIFTGDVDKINNFKPILKKFFPDILKKYSKISGIAS